MSTLREQVEALPDCDPLAAASPADWWISRAAVLDLIPEGAVLVRDAAQLEQAMRDTMHLPSDDGHDLDGHWDEWSPAILVRLRVES